MTEDTKKNNSPIAAIIVTLIIAGGAGFYAGMKYEQRTAQNRFANFRNGGNGQFLGRAGGQNINGNIQGRQGFQPVNGEIISSDDKTITVKLTDGSTKIVLLSDSTTINKAESGTKDDLKDGEKVLIIGTSNSDGSVSAQNIQLNPQDRGMFRSEATPAQ